MSYKDSPTEALKKIEFQLESIVKNEALKLQSDLISVSPVDTNHFKTSWQPLQRVGRWTWRISNTAKYATILASGRHNIGGRMYGSLQWSNGLAPMLQKTDRNIKAKSDKVRE